MSHCAQIYYSRSGVGSQKCITYEDVNQAVSDAKESFSGGRIPPEIYELTSDTPTPEHITVPAEISEFSALRLGSTMKSTLFRA